MYDPREDVRGANKKRTQPAGHSVPRHWRRACWGLCFGRADISETLGWGSYLADLGKSLDDASHGVRKMVFWKTGQFQITVCSITLLPFSRHQRDRSPNSFTTRLKPRPKTHVTHTLFLSRWGLCILHIVWCIQLITISVRCCMHPSAHCKGMGMKSKKRRWEERCLERWQKPKCQAWWGPQGKPGVKGACGLQEGSCFPIYTTYILLNTRTSEVWGWIFSECTCNTMTSFWKKTLLHISLNNLPHTSNTSPDNTWNSIHTRSMWRACTVSSEEWRQESVKLTHCQVSSISCSFLLEAGPHSPPPLKGNITTTLSPPP